MARATAQIYASYPDYGKVAPDFVQAVATHLNSYYSTPWVLDRLADPRTGIATTTLLMPSVSQLRDFAMKAIDERAKFERYHEVQKRKQTYSAPSARAREPFRPFPKLWAAFADEPAIVDRLDWIGFTFAQLDNFGRTHATRGIDAARVAIANATPGFTDKWTPPPPKVDISDLPDRLDA